MLMNPPEYQMCLQAQWWAGGPSNAYGKNSNCHLPECGRRVTFLIFGDQTPNKKQHKAGRAYHGSRHDSRESTEELPAHTGWLIEQQGMELVLTAVSFAPFYSVPEPSSWSAWSSLPS